MTLRQAREKYFEANGFPLDGGYSDKWVPLKFGWFKAYLYNSKARKEAVPLHDLHHIITGYQTDPIGEAEISIWELAAGTHSKHFATLINLSAVFYGVILAPRKLFHAYIIGRCSNTFYRKNISDELLDMKLVDARKVLLPNERPIATFANYAVFVAIMMVSYGILFSPVVLLIKYL